MGTPGLPALGDVVGLTRLNRQSAERLRPKDLPEAKKPVWAEELSGQYRAATQVESSGAAASSSGQGGT